MGNIRGIAFTLVCAAILCAQPKQIAIEHGALHQFEGGPEMSPTHEFVPGESVYVSCRLTGYHLEKIGEVQQVKLDWQIRAVDPAGIPIEKPKSGHIEDRVLPQDKNWMPKFVSTFVVPPFAPSGIYRIPMEVKDEVDGGETKQELTFHVRGHPVDPSPTLVARNFQFLRSEDDQVALHSPVYHPGDMLWARFDITGYKFGDNNRFSVDYGLAVLNATGTQVFSQPGAASDSKESFYPQRYVPGMLSLSLDKNVPKGNYTLVVTVRDLIGNQTWDVSQPFQVE